MAEGVVRGLRSQLLSSSLASPSVACTFFLHTPLCFDGYVTLEFMSILLNGSIDTHRRGRKMYWSIAGLSGKN